MNDYVSQVFKHYKCKGIVIDTNILLLWCVGTVNRSRISKFSRTEKFLPEDYDIILKVLEYFNKIVTTPNILTEVNSLVNQMGEPERSQCLQVLGQGVTKLDEFYIRPLAKKIYVIMKNFEFSTPEPTHNCKVLPTNYNGDHNDGDDF
ncbi:hypothetical protein NG792_21980, partial [Laspinema sp. C3]|nr:hypothetical protein [Laspinema sp. D3b]